MKALVLGASGFAGAALSERLLALGHEVRGLQRPGARGALASGVEAREGELADPDSIARAASGCELVFHCAGESSRHAPPDLLAWVHVAGMENVINAARHAGVLRVVVLSCAEVNLCNSARVSWKEDTVLGQAPLGAWARSKLLGEELALQASDARLSVCALRPGFLWGPGERTHLPALCREARAGGVRLFGTGDNLIATLYIDNLVDALLAAAQAPEVSGLAINVNDGEYASARAFFGLLCDALGLPAPRRGVYGLSYATAWLRRARGAPGAWPEDVARRGRACLLDCRRAANVLDYHPRVGHEQGKQALARWARELGGPSAVERLARPAPGSADAERFARLADELGARVG